MLATVGIGQALVEGWKSAVKDSYRRDLKVNNRKRSNHVKTKKYVTLESAKCTVSAVESHLYLDPLWTEYFI